jgi:hypothetical protein
VTDPPRTEAEFVQWLVARHQGLAPVATQHLSDNDELLAQVLFGDVTRCAADLARRATEEPQADAELIALLRDLDQALLPEGQPDDPVNNLVWVSFVENASTDADEPLRGRLREFPNLARALSYFE